MTGRSIVATLLLSASLAQAAPDPAPEPPVGAVPIPTDARMDDARLAELRRVPLQRYTLDEGGTVRTNLTSLGRDHMLALVVHRDGEIMLHFIAMGAGTVVAIPVLDARSDGREEVVAPVGRRDRGDVVFFHVRRDDVEVAVFRVGDQVRIAVHDQAGWEVRRAITLAKRSSVQAIESTFPH